MDRKSLLSAAIGAQFTFPSELHPFGGHVYEVRTPSVAGRSRILAAGEVAGPAAKDKGSLDHARLLARAVIECTFVPTTLPDGSPALGGAERVFDVEHMANLLETPPGGIVDTLGQVALRLMNVKAADLGKA